ncbi:hypothetical protein ACLESO_15410, partial [Pyxidicoccus sp. 3LG]
MSAFFPLPKKPAPTAGDSEARTGSSTGFDFSRIPIHAQPSAAFPHRSEIERSFGATFPGRAVLDSEGCAQRGVRAFTENGTTHFASARPGLQVAAHEAAHLAQHAGLTRDAHLGPEGHA